MPLRPPLLWRRSCMPPPRSLLWGGYFVCPDFLWLVPPQGPPAIFINHGTHDAIILIARCSCCLVPSCARRATRCAITRSLGRTSPHRTWSGPRSSGSSGRLLLLDVVGTESRR